MSCTDSPPASVMKRQQTLVKQTEQYHMPIPLTDADAKDVKIRQYFDWKESLQEYFQITLETPYCEQMLEQATRASSEQHVDFKKLLDSRTPTQLIQIATREKSLCMGRSQKSHQRSK